MRDPHVERLHYDAGSGVEHISYKADAAPLAFSNAVGKFDLRDGKLQVEPAEHFADEESAKQVIDGFLRAWEIESDLKMNAGQIRFRFKHSEIVDRNPVPPGSGQIVAMKGVGGLLSISGKATLSLACSRYPDPPSAFAATVDVQRAHRRWQRYRDGKEPLQAMAYFVLTVVETMGGRKLAAKTLSIELAVLRIMGELSSERGDAETARKAPKSPGSYRELSGQEKQWLDAAVRKVIQRLGEHAAGKASARLVIGDLPLLP
jgi:hypothetical protein